MGNSKKETKPQERLHSEKDDLEDLDLFIEKRKTQNKALKKLIPENDKKQKKSR